MVGMIRNWLLGIVKQAIREVEAEDVPTMDPVLANRVNSSYNAIQHGNLSAETINSAWPAQRAVPRYRYPEVAPVLFEQEQAQSLQEQDAYWTKKILSDL